jgi:hypothetical protein
MIPTSFLRADNAERSVTEMQLSKIRYGHLSLDGGPTDRGDLVRELS